MERNIERWYNASPDGPIIWGAKDEADKKTRNVDLTETFGAVLVKKSSSKNIQLKAFERECKGHLDQIRGRRFSATPGQIKTEESI